MPRVSAFYGVVIYMYWNERDHPVAHFHAYHAGRRASVSADGEVLAGSLEPRALQFVREWAAGGPPSGKDTSLVPKPMPRPGIGQRSAVSGGTVAAVEGPGWRGVHGSHRTGTAGQAA